MTIMDELDQQQQEQNGNQQTSELLRGLLDRLDGIEKNQREVVKASNEATQNVSRVWVELEQLQQLMQQQMFSDAIARESLEKTLKTLASTQSGMLEVLDNSKSVKLPDGSSARPADVSAHVLMQKVSARIETLETTNSRLADEVHLKRAINIDHEKVARHIVPKLGAQILAHENAVKEAFGEASAPVLAELVKSRTALIEAGEKASAQVRRASGQVEKLAGVVTWRTVGQVSGALLPLAVAVVVVLGAAQTVWAAFGFQPILQTVWAWFLDAQEWYWKLAIAGSAFAVLAAFGWLTFRIGKKVSQLYRGY